MKCVPEKESWVIPSVIPVAANKLRETKVLNKNVLFFVQLTIAKNHTNFFLNSFAFLITMPNSLMKLACNWPAFAIFLPVSSTQRAMKSKKCFIVKIFFWKI